MTHSSTIRISSALASDLMLLARFDMTCTLPRIYPSSGTILSSDGEYADPPCLSPNDSGTPSIGHVLGSSKSFMVKSKGIERAFARAFTRFRIDFFMLSPKARFLALAASRCMTFLRAAFSGLVQYASSYSLRVSPVEFLAAFARFAHNLEQKCRARFLNQQSGSVRSVPHSSHLKVAVFMGLIMGETAKIVNCQWTNGLTIADLLAGKKP